jgi:hypothetical protein
MEYWGWRESSESGAIHGTYQDSLCRFCTWLLEKGYRVLLLSGDDMDDRAIRSLKSLIEVRLSNPSLVRNVLAERAHGLADVMMQMAGPDVIVATRYHNVVCALKMEKNAALLEDAGLGGYVDYVEAFDVERLKDRFEQLVAERSALAKGIAVFTALTRKRLQHQEERLRARFQGALPQIVRVADGGAVGSAAPHADASQKGPLKEAPATGRRSPWAGSSTACAFLLRDDQGAPRSRARKPRGRARQQRRILARQGLRRETQRPLVGASSFRRRHAGTLLIG